jgi:hypothetical protein
MATQRLTTGLTVMNFAILAFLLGQERPWAAVAAAASRPQASPAVTQDVAPSLRGRALELLDERDRVRARLSVEPEGEVVLRLIDRAGTIRVKLGAGEDGSGLLLLDEATEPGVHLIARRTGTAERPTTTSLTLRGADGQQRVIRP